MTPDRLRDRRLGVLISGRGSNLQALIEATRDGRLDADIVVVISNQPEAVGLVRARDAGIPAICVSHRGWAVREDFDRALVTELRAHDVSLVCLAGFMRLVGQPMLDAFPGAILNIHPSLLPAFPGVDAQRQAVDHGVKISGATVHFVTPELDGGPIVLQRSVPVLASDTADTLAARILAAEHRVYPEAVQTVLEGGWRIEGRRFIAPPRDAESRSPLRADS
jgi:phosphoribosylglycinamide formyltransferase-1